MKLSRRRCVLLIPHTVDPATGPVSANQVILVQDGKFTAVGPTVAIPAGAKVMGKNANYADVALRDVRFVLKNGMVFKQDGVMLPVAFFNGGPVNGYTRR